MASCDACGGPVSEETERTTRKLLASLDQERKEQLVETYLGHEPHVLCAVCMNSLTMVLNTRVMAAAAARKTVAD